MRPVTQLRKTVVSMALAGNPNSGKTTVFNALTGSEQYVGNWPGVTVEKKEGTSRLTEESVRVTDLPGIYSLTSCTAEEQVAKDHLLSGGADVIVNIVDASHLERSLFLTLQLLETGAPMVIALTFTDVLKKQGARLDTGRLSDILKVPVTEVSAIKKRGLRELLQTAVEVSDDRKKMFSEPSESPSEKYERIEKIVAKVLSGGERKSSFADKILVGKWTALPVFILMMLAVFYLTFGPVGAYLAGSTGFFTENIVSPFAKRVLERGTASDWFCELILKGILPGVGGILSFVPQTAMLFFFLAILEDSGYMARAAFVTDSLMAKAGLSGRSVVPMLLGFGCSVPAILSSKTAEGKRQQRVTAMLVPFMSCSAKLPVYGAVASVFFGEKAFVFILALYLLGILSGALTALLYKDGGSADRAFTLELPPYRRPTLKNALLHTGERVESFIKKAGTTILLASAAIWLLSSYAPDLTRAAGEESILGVLGGMAAPFLEPLGFGTWQAAAALVSGLAAKEMIVSSLAVMYGTAAAGISSFTPLSACSFLVFVLLYPPCAAAQAAMKKETGGGWTAAAVAWQLLLAWVMSFIVYSAGRLLGFK